MKHVLIAHNLRSCYNVGSLLRTCDGLGVDMVMTGTTPYPKHTNDSRLPHIAERAEKQIAKTALGAETSVNWQYFADIQDAVEQLKANGYLVAALEQTPTATDLPAGTDDRWALIVGHEVDGVDADALKLVDEVWQIPMAGDKQSLNVAIAAAIGLYSLLD